MCSTYVIDDSFMSYDPSKINDLLIILSEIKDDLNQIKIKLDDLIKSKEKFEIASDKRREELETLDVMTLLSLPDHLRKTAMILSRLGSAMASQVSKESGRARAVESGYLNQLVVMNYIKKRRKGRNVYFYIE